MLSRHLLLTAAMLTALPFAAFADTKLTVQFAWLPNSAETGEIVALEKGFFKERGLDVTFLPGGPSANPVQDLLGGTADIAIAYAPQIMYAGARGLPVTSIFATWQQAPLTYYSLGEKNITSVKDWKGKRIGGSQSGIPQVKAILEHNGLSFDDITYVQSDVPGLMQDQVDAVAAWPTNVAQLAPITSHAGGYNTQSIWDNGLQFQSNYYIVRKPDLAGNAKTYEAFLSAVDEGWAWAADHRKEAIDLLVKYAPALEADKEADALDVTLDKFIYTDATKQNGFGQISPEVWQATIDTYTKLGEIPEGLKAADVFDPTILDATERTKR